MVSNRATGRRIGRLVGEVDGMGLELAAMSTAVFSAPTEGSGPHLSLGFQPYDEREQELLVEVQRHQSLLAEGLEELAKHLNHRDGRS